MIELQLLLDEIVEFQLKTFPTSNAISKLYHLKKEVNEIINEFEKNPVYFPRIESEYADCFILLLGSISMWGMNAEDIFRIIREKMEINRNRKWGTPDEDGVVLHIKEEEK